MKNPANLARWALLISVGIALGYLLRGGAAEPSPAPAQASAPAVESVWTCSMHPQIRRSEPGLCPICAMDLVLADPTSGGSGGLRQLSVSPEQRELMRIRTTAVERRSVETEIRMVGKIDYDETRLAYITAWVPGRIDQLYVDYTGVSVSAGDHMVNLYSPDLYSAQQELLQASRAVAQSQLPALRSSTAATLDAARERLRQWGLSDAQIEAVEESGEAAAHTTLHAPVGGLVIQKNVQEGMYVDVGTRIFTIADLDQVWVKFDAYESDLAWLRFGQEVTFETEAYPGEVFRGTISFIDPMLDPRTRTVKVRVVADNRAGRLKPAMFVRATIRASVAGRGKVLDPSLVGKWISPMHPEIVKDEPGACDVCGMDLVPAETLGYASPTEDEVPLVIPRSAALVTGRRAVVFVELPGQERPTFEGREVVLGPRAGEWYVVRHGLEEGERVVVEGNFKLDSALQLDARPSMMSPEGGEAGADSHQGHESHGTAMRILEPVERAVAGVDHARESGDVQLLQAAFDALASSAAAVDLSAERESVRAEWNEVAMRLANDAFEGSSASTLEGADEALQSLASTVARMRKRLGTKPAAHAVASVEPTPPAFATWLEESWRAYLDVHAGLAADDPTAASSAAARAAAHLAGADASGLSGARAQVWEAERAELARALEALREATTLEAMRREFEHLSAALERTLRAFPLPDTRPRLALCPMAIDGRSGTWLQDGDTIVNPYMGPRMLTCGSLLETLPAEAHRDH